MLNYVNPHSKSQVKDGADCGKSKTETSTSALGQKSGNAASRQQPETDTGPRRAEVGRSGQPRQDPVLWPRSRILQEHCQKLLKEVMQHKPLGTATPSRSLHVQLPNSP